MRPESDFPLLVASASRRPCSHHPFRHGIELGRFMSWTVSTTIFGRVNGMLS